MDIVISAMTTDCVFANRLQCTVLDISQLLLELTFMIP